MDKEISRVLTHASKLLKNQKFQEANEIYQNLTLQFQDNSELYHEFGIALIAQNQPKLAIEKFLQSVRLDPKNANYNSDLGEMYRRVGMLDQAIKFNLEAVKLNSDLDNTNYNLGLAYFDKENFNKAIVFFEKAIEINPKHGFAWNNLGSSLEKLDKLKLAHEAYQIVITSKP
jgi:tetratricopeptide (TPR) repeat protein